MANLFAFASPPLTLVIIGVFFAVFFIMYLNLNSITQFIHNKSLGQRDEIIKYLELMFVEVDVEKLTKQLLFFSFGLGALFFLICWPNILLSVAMGVTFSLLGWIIPKHIVVHLYEKRCNQFVQQMVDGLTILSNGIRAGISLQDAMGRAAKNLPNPLAQEFDKVLSQINVGQTLEDALNELGERIPRADVQMFVTAVNILRTSGGNMGETFQTITYTIRERQKIEKKIEALTSGAIMQGVIITMVPFILLGIFWVSDPTLVKPLFTTFPGMLALAGVIGLQTVGGLIIRRIVDIKV